MQQSPHPAAAWIRIMMGAAAIAVVLYSYFHVSAAGQRNPFDFFGYFTNQTSLATGVILIGAGLTRLRGRNMAWLVYARAISVSCMMIVAVIYNGIVPGTGSAPAWVSASLHIILPAYVIADWALVPDRPRLAWRTIWLVFPYPLTWLTVVLVRSATDGWVPYGFLLPSHGAASLSLHVAGLVIALWGAGAITWAASRIQLGFRASSSAH